MAAKTLRNTEEYKRGFLFSIGADAANHFFCLYTLKYKVLLKNKHFLIK